jgi:hypothetical protein
LGRHELLRFFKSGWTQKRYEAESRFDFNTMASAVVAFQKSGTYRIRVKGHLDENWSDRLAGMRINSGPGADQNPETTLFGRIRDQAELAGVLNSLYELHLSILSVDYLDTTQSH